MGRPSSFDAPALISAVMPVFRRKGFGHTTLKDLERATGLHPGSLYNAYESKEGLFQACLDTYLERVVEGRIAQHLEQGDALEGLYRYFTSTFEVPAWPDPGCLVTNTAVEGANLDARAQRFVQHALAIIERALLRALRRAQAQGRLSRSTPVRALAAQLLTLYQGVLVLVRAGMPKARLRRIVAGTFTSLQLHPKRGRTS
jgi:TetR/AcrR family transcriptional repressor of nem operon